MDYTKYNLTILQGEGVNFQGLPKRKLAKETIKFFLDNELVTA